jgi:hypothetical protein
MLDEAFRHDRSQWGLVVDEKQMCSPFRHLRRANRLTAGCGGVKG